MKYLLDIPALMAWQHVRQTKSGAFHKWIASVGPENVVTCAHVELGFLRVSMQVFGLSLAEATKDLIAIRTKTGGFVSEAPPPNLPAWADKHARTSDGYLAQIAQAQGVKLATFDRGVPGAEVIQG